jgi:hypothetical protein
MKLFIYYGNLKQQYRLSKGGAAVITLWIERWQPMK